MNVNWVSNSEGDHRLKLFEGEEVSGRRRKLHNEVKCFIIATLHNEWHMGEIRCA
jgi:hypothetical protein